MTTTSSGVASARAALRALAARVEHARDEAERAALRPRLREIIDTIQQGRAVEETTSRRASTT